MNELASLLKNNLKHIQSLPANEQREILALMEQLKDSKEKEQARENATPSYQVRVCKLLVSGMVFRNVS